MVIRNLYILFILIILLISCEKKINHIDSDKFLKSIKDLSGIKSKTGKVFYFQPLNGFRIEQPNRLAKEVSKTFGKVYVGENRKLPKSFYVKERNRYRADSIIKVLRNAHGQDTITIGLISSDISTTAKGVKDWGVFGLGYHPGSACVVSTYRLKKRNADEQFYKVVVHEIGHTIGLPHCPEKTCLMRDAEGGNPLDEEKDFCVRCKKILVSKGFILRD